MVQSIWTYAPGPNSIHLRPPARQKHAPRKPCGTPWGSPVPRLSRSTISTEVAGWASTRAQSKPATLSQDHSGAERTTSMARRAGTAEPGENRVGSAGRDPCAQSAASDQRCPASTALVSSESDPEWSYRAHTVGQPLD